MDLQEALEYQEKGMDVCELVGGPRDGALALTLTDYPSYNTAVYHRSFRVSSQHYTIYCYDFVGYLIEPEVRKLAEDSWK